MALSNPNWRRKDDEEGQGQGQGQAQGQGQGQSANQGQGQGQTSFFSQQDIGSSLMVPSGQTQAGTPTSPISSASNTPFNLSPDKRPIDGRDRDVTFSPQTRPMFSGRSRTGSFHHRNPSNGTPISLLQESKEETPLLTPQQHTRQHSMGGAPIPPGFQHRRTDSQQGRGLMPKTGPNSAAALAHLQQQQQQQQQQQGGDEKGKNNPWSEIRPLNATTIAQAIHSDGTKPRRVSFNRGSSQPPIGSHQNNNNNHNHIVPPAAATAAIVNHVPTTQGIDKQPLLLLRSKSRDDTANAAAIAAAAGVGAGGAPTPTGSSRMTPLTPKSVKRTAVQRLVPNTTNPDSPLTFIPENNIIRFNKLMLEDVTLESMKAPTPAAGSTPAAAPSVGSGANSGSTTPRTQSLSSSTIAAILAQQAAVQKDAQSVNAVYADEELIRKRAESLQYDLHRLQEKKLRSNLRSEEHRLRQESLDIEHKEAQLLNHLQQSLVQCAEQKDSKVFQCVQFQQELQEKINTLQRMFDKMTNRIGVLEAEYVTCVSSLREEYSSIMTEYYTDPEIVNKKLGSIQHFVEVEQLKTTLSEQGVQVIAGRPNITTVPEDGQLQPETPQTPAASTNPNGLTISRRTSLMMFPHQTNSVPTLSGRQISAAPVLQPHIRINPNASPNASPPINNRFLTPQANSTQGIPMNSPTSTNTNTNVVSSSSQFGIAPQLRRSSTFSGGVANAILPGGSKRPSLSLHPSLMPSPANGRGPSGSPMAQPQASPQNQPPLLSPNNGVTVAPTPTNATTPAPAGAGAAGAATTALAAPATTGAADSGATPPTPLNQVSPTPAPSS